MMADSEPAFKVPPPLPAAGCSKEGSPSSAAKTSENVPPLVYSEPDWGGSAPVKNYYFEVIKQGTIIANIPVAKSFLVIGRLASCDIPVEHPSCSRYHAILQYCKGGAVYPEGLYVYDLGSTHGTYVNKEQIRSKVYYRLRTGHILKFGASTRMYVMQGPEKEEEPMQVRRVEERESCDWGIVEDAEEEEEDDEEESSENPFALSTENEELYLSDPKKALRDWFEREGFDLEYHVEEKGFKNFVCQVKLPIDNPTGEDFVPVEASVSGKKKDAVVACALEACRVLDRFGLLRQAQKESRKRKRKNWEEEDFYDSDEDTYLDRTGAIEKKREFRKKLLNYDQQPETYESLTKKIDEISKEITEIEEKLAKSKPSSVPVQEDEHADPLDSYMSTIENADDGNIDAVTKSRLRQRLNDLRNDKNKFDKMRDAICPPGMLMMETVTSETPESSEVESEMSNVSEKPEVLLVHPVELTKEYSSESESEHEIIIPMCSSPKSQASSVENSLENECGLLREADIDEQKSLDCNQESEISSEAEYLDNTEKITSDQQVDDHAAEGEHSASSEEWNDSAVEYSMWLPPDDQSGDGTTSLNAKFGY